MKYTNEEFLKRLHEIRDDVEVLENYKGSDKKILFKCKNCGYEWYSTPNHIINAKRTCPNCTGTIKTNERFIKELEKINPNVIPQEIYKKNSEKILCKCKICGYEWKATPNNLLSRKSGCPMCGIKKVNESNTLTSEEFFKNVEKRKNINIEILDDKYINNRTKMNVRCKICGYEWRMSPSNILQGNGCPNCHISRLENGIKEVLNKKKVTYQWQVKKDVFEWLNRQSLDFYLPDYNVAIECQGEQHFKPVKYFGGVNRFIDTIDRDKKKKDLIINNGNKIAYIIEKRFKKNISSNVLLEEIYSNVPIIWVETDRHGNLKEKEKKRLIESNLITDKKQE